MKNIHKCTAFIFCLVAVSHDLVAAHPVGVPVQLTEEQKEVKLTQISCALSVAILERNAHPGDKNEYARYEATRKNLEQQVRKLYPNQDGVKWTSVVQQACRFSESSGNIEMSAVNNDVHVSWPYVDSTDCMATNTFVFGQDSSSLGSGMGNEEYSYKFSDEDVAKLWNSGKPGGQEH